MPQISTHRKTVWTRALTPLLICLLLVAHIPIARASVYGASVHPMLLSIAAENPDQRVRVIVQELNPGSDTESLVVQYGGEVVQDLRIINAYVAEVPAHAVPRLGWSDQIRWISPDAEMVETGQLSPPTTTVRDEFTEASFAGSSGNHAWLSPWAEVGEADGPESGDVTVSRFLGGSMQGLRIQETNRGVFRAADLSEVDSATLSFTYRRKGFDSAADLILVEISADGGTTWAELDRLTGPATDEAMVSAKYDVSSFGSESTTIRFVSGEAMSSRAKIYIDDVEIALVRNDVDGSNAHDLFLPMITTRDDVSPELQMDQYVQAATANPSGCTLLLDGDFEAGLANWSWGSPQLTSDANSGQNAARLGPSSSSTSQAVATAVAGETYILSGMFKRPSGSSWMGMGIDFRDANWNEISGDDVTIQDSDSYKPTRLIAVAPPGTAHLSIWIHNGGGGYLHMDDLELTTATMTSTYPCVRNFNVSDEFTARSFTGNSGSQNWSNSWLEVGESDGVAQGKIRVVNNGQCASGRCLRIGGNGNGTYAMVRSVDLSGASQATFSYNWRRHYTSNGMEDDGYWSDRPLKVQISGNNGGSWTTIHEIESGLDTLQRTESIDISNFASPNTQIRFTTDSAWWFSGYAYFDNIKIEHNGVGGSVDTNTIDSTYVKSIKADQLWNAPSYIRGSDITVAIVDSGLARHGDLNRGRGNSRIVGQVDFSSGNGSVDDFYGHGTHVAGAIGGNGNHSTGSYMGVAPGVNLLDVKVTDDYGAGSMSNVIAGLQWILENRETYDIRVVNLSLNSTVAESYHTSPLSAALEILWFNRIVVVVSAGNNGTSNQGVVYPPANDPFVITVGAMNDAGTPNISDDQLSPFSAYGTTPEGYAKPDLVAPGTNIIAALASDDSNLALDHPAHTVSGAAGNHYFRMSGTSMASAVAAGAVALLLQDEPNLTPDQVKHRLMTTAKSISGQPNGSTGAGYLDIYAAVHGNSTANANTNVPASQLLWSGNDPIAWNSVNWNSVNWNSVNWNSVNWNSVNWNSVNWNSVNWDD